MPRDRAVDFLYFLEGLSYSHSFFCLLSITFAHPGVPPRNHLSRLTSPAQVYHSSTERKLPKMRRPILLTALFATPALLQEQGLAFSIGNISGTGSGCPEDSWGLFVEAGEFGFIEFNATIGLEDERPHLDCNLAIELNEVQKGHRVVLRQVNVGGRAGMDEGVQATIRTSTSWTGEEGSEVGILFSTFLLCFSSSLGINRNLRVSGS